MPNSSLAVPLGLSTLGTGASGALALASADTFAVAVAVAPAYVVGNAASAHKMSVPSAQP